MSEPKLADLKTPEPIEIELLKNKKAIIGPFTFDIIYWIEEKWGSFERFQQDFLSKFSEGHLPPFTEIIELVFQLLDNQDAFDGNVRTFAKHVPFSAAADLNEAIRKAMVFGLPESPESEGDDASEGDAPKG